ncbi:hypothetical protein [Stutzerimonas nitrititolerans]|uniref:hypothetical protein n=1 Tax=Stutzerimonas nitrititolerans TaxID=2482751 RepID=UPI00289E5586|nr:hypothetical protein [Stutzerimonas nitrititolerans]
MDDRELLEMAAKAAGYVVRWYDDTLAYGPTFGIEVEPGNPCGFDPWNPLTDDGDALRLAVKLKLIIGSHGGGGEVWFDDQKGCEGHIEQDYGADGSLSELEAMRLAIVRAAAEIGRAM